MLIANNLRVVRRKPRAGREERTLPRVVLQMQEVPGANSRLKPTIYLPSLDRTRGVTPIWR